LYESFVLSEVREHAFDRDGLLEALHAYGFAEVNLGHAAGFEPLDYAILLLSHVVGSFRATRAWVVRAARFT